MPPSHFQKFVNRRVMEANGFAKEPGLLDKGVPVYSVHRVSLCNDERVDVLILTRREPEWVYVMDVHGRVGWTPIDALDIDRDGPRDRDTFYNDDNRTIHEMVLDIASDDELAIIRHDRGMMVRHDLSEATKLREANASLREQIERMEAGEECGEGALKKEERARKRHQAQLDAKNAEIVALKNDSIVGAEQAAAALTAAKRDADAKGAELRRLRIGMNILHEKFRAKSAGYVAEEEGWASNEGD